MLGQVTVQLISIGSTIVYSGSVSYLLFKLVAFRIQGLRVSKDQETTGLDLIEHDEVVYNL